MDEEETMLAILLCFLLFWGTPDLYDKIEMALDKYIAVSVCNW